MRELDENIASFCTMENKIYRIELSHANAHAINTEESTMAVAKKALAKKAAPAKTAAKKPAAKKTTATKRTTAKKAAPKKLGKVVFELDGQQIDIKAIEKKAAKLGGDVYVVAAEKKIFDKDGKSVDLF